MRRRAGCFAPLAPILTVALLIRGLLEALEGLWSAKALVVGNRLAKRDIVRVSGKLLQNCIINREFILRLLQARIRVRHQKRDSRALTGFGKSGKKFRPALKYGFALTVARVKFEQLHVQIRAASRVWKVFVQKGQQFRRARAVKIGIRT